MTGEVGVSADLRTVREGRVPGEESSGEKERERADFSTDTDAGCGEEHWSETSSSVGEEPHGETESEDGECASASSGGFAEQPRLMYHEVVDMEGQVDDAAGLLD